MPTETRRFVGTRRGEERLSRCSLRHPPNALSNHLWPVCIRSFPIHEKEKRTTNKRKKKKERSRTPAKSRRRNEERGREKETEKDEEGSSGLHRFLNLLGRVRGKEEGNGEGRRDSAGAAGRGKRERGGPFRICPIENLSDVHCVTSSCHFYRRFCARTRPLLRSPCTSSFLRVLAHLFFKRAPFFFTSHADARGCLFFLTPGPSLPSYLRYNPRLVNNSDDRRAEGRLKKEVFYPRRCYKLFRIVKNSKMDGGASPVEVLEFLNREMFSL